MAIVAKAILFSLFAALAPGSGARTEGAMSLRMARELSLTESTILRKAEISVGAATLAARTQGYSFLPQLSASASGSYALRRNFPIAGAEMRLAANMTIFDGGRNAGLAEKLGIATESAIEDLLATRIALIGQADAAFFASLAATSAVEAAEGDLEAASVRLDIAQLRIAAGSLPQADYPSSRRKRPTSRRLSSRRR